MMFYKHMILILFNNWKIIKYDKISKKKYFIIKKNQKIQKKMNFLNSYSTKTLIELGNHRVRYPK